MAASLLMILLAVTILLASGPTDARPNSVTSPWKDSYGLGPAAAVVAAAHKGEASKVCEPDHLTVYRVIVNTFWNDRLFPKHFPQWRPPAQWTKLVGQFSQLSL
jgi:Spondin_N